MGAIRPRRREAIDQSVLQNDAVNVANALILPRRLSLWMNISHNQSRLLFSASIGHSRPGNGSIHRAMMIDDVRG